MRIKFITSPTGSFKLAYNIGAEVESDPNGINDAQCNELIKAGAAEDITPAPVAKKEIKKAKPSGKASNKY